MLKASLIHALDGVTLRYGRRVAMVISRHFGEMSRD